MHELQEAFREAARREFAMVPAETELAYAFSDRFERKMRRMIRAEARGYWNLINTTAKRAAIAAAIFLTLLSTALAIRPIRERVIQFFIEVYEEYFEIRFGKEEKDDIDPTPKPMVRYTLTELPEGYEEVKYIESDAFLWTSWQNKEGDGISLRQEAGTNEITLDRLPEKTDRIFLNDLEVLVHTVKETKMYIWEQDEYVFYLSCFEEIPAEVVYQMIETIKPTE